MDSDRSYLFDMMEHGATLPCFDEAWHSLIDAPFIFKIQMVACLTFNENQIPLTSFTLNVTFSKQTNLKSLCKATSLL